ncbi:MAG: hypothetical protein FAZ92_00324 [Accumulibacter sp.]|uniref:hypothetical protein n=2 Tax=Accumulibacter sp. TaxID=2053492 RepID=UPI00121FC33F|nr:hypothetical protein [Accumulibacter sp.]TLD47393.1 MAG: hypothetical protein FAZ92_00324 [Accumulibacter sp.]
MSLFPLPIMRLVDSARSMVAVLRANSAMVRAHRLQARGKLEAALVLARSGLAVLRKPYVRRRNPMEGLALASLTILAEEISSQLQASGATADDLADAIAYLKQLSDDPQPDLCSSITFLETRRAAASRQPSA